MTSPVIAADPTTGVRYVFVGTGRLLADSDLVNPQTETYYAFVDGTNAAIDTSSTFPISRSNLVLNDPATGVTLASTDRGFYIDLAAATTNGAGTQASAERVNVQPVASGGITAFAANLYGQDMCVKGSTRIFALNYDTSVESWEDPAANFELDAFVIHRLFDRRRYQSLAGCTAKPLTTSSASGMMLMWGLDTTAAAALNESSASNVRRRYPGHGSPTLIRTQLARSSRQSVVGGTFASARADERVSKNGGAMPPFFCLAFRTSLVRTCRSRVVHRCGIVVAMHTYEFPALSLLRRSTSRCGSLARRHPAEPMHVAPR